MFRISRLEAVLKGLPRSLFASCVREHEGDKYAKGFRCWDQAVALIYAQLSGTDSLRTLESSFNGASRHHYHLGTRPLRRSTLSEAMTARREAVFASVAERLMAQAARSFRSKWKRQLRLLDSTSFTLKGRGYDGWTLTTRTRHTQGLKLHVLLDGEREAPVRARFSAANVNDRDVGVEMPIEKGAMYVFDKGYCDYRWWAKLAAESAYFVTRFKRNAALRVESERPIPAEDAGTILDDRIVRFAHTHSRGGRPAHPKLALREVTVKRPSADPLVLATNDFDSPAREIAALYQQRWDIELYFKWIKQHLRLTRFLGRSAEAVRIQILCALIAHLLLGWYRQFHRLEQSLWLLLTDLRTTLFEREGAVEAARRRRERQTAIAKRQGQLFA